MLVLLKHQLMQMFSHRPTVCSKCYGPLVPKFTNNVIEPDVSLLCSGCETSVMCDKVKPLKCGKRKIFSADITQPVGYACMLKGESYRNLQATYAFLGLKPISKST